MEIQGVVASGFEAVADAFRSNFTANRDVGAACCIYRNGQPVVNIWGGLADPASAAPWREDSLQLCFSATKGPTTICILQLMEQGLLDIDAPVANYWPEFGCNGKEQITTRMILSHRAGLPAVEGDLTLQDVFAWTPVVDALARQAPSWLPGTEHGYHPRSFGWLLGEILRRITGKTLGQYLHDHVTAPIAADFYVGLPAREFARCTRLLPDQATPSFSFVPSELTIKALTGPSNLFSYSDMWNDLALLQAEMPSSNGVGTAEGLARIYAATLGEINGVRLLKPETVEAACRVQSQGVDRIVTMETCFGLGFMLPPWLAKDSCGPQSYGHFGAGGSMAMADPEAGVAMAYVMNQMRLDPDDPRAVDLINAMYDCVG